MIHHGIRQPSVILSDRDIACLNSLKAAFPNGPSMTCRWHMNNNILARTRIVLGQEEVPNPGPFEDKHQNTAETDCFMNLYCEAINSGTASDFDKARAALTKLRPLLS